MKKNDHWEHLLKYPVGNKMSLTGWCETSVFTLGGTRESWWTEPVCYRDQGGGKYSELSPSHPHYSWRPGAAGPSIHPIRHPGSSGQVQGDAPVRSTHSSH